MGLTADVLPTATPPLAGDVAPTPPLREEEVYDRLDQMRAKRGWLFVFALGCGVFWGIAAAHFDVWWSWPIVPLGAFFGWAWCRVGQGSAAWAVGLTVGVYMVSGVAATTMSHHYPSQRMIQQQPAVLEAAVHLWMQQHDELPKLTGVSLLGDDAAGDLGAEVVTAFDIQQLVEQEIAGLSPVMQRTILSWYYEQDGGRAGLERHRGWGSRFVAFLWLATGGWLAWRLAGRKPEIDLG